MCGIVGLVGRVAPGARDPLAGRPRRSRASGPGRDRGAPRGPWGPGPSASEPAGCSSSMPRTVSRYARAAAACSSSTARSTTTRRSGASSRPPARPSAATATPTCWPPSSSSEGPAGLRRVEGSYAFGFLAGADGPLLFGRDPLGVRPLCLRAPARRSRVRQHGDRAAGRGRRPAGARPRRAGRRAARRRRLHPTHGVRGVRRVAPGEVICVDRGLGVRTETVPPPPPPEPARRIGGERGDRRRARRAARRGPRPTPHAPGGGGVPLGGRRQRAGRGARARGRAGPGLHAHVPRASGGGRVAARPADGPSPRAGAHGRSPAPAIRPPGCSRPPRPSTSPSPTRARCRPGASPSPRAARCAWRSPARAGTRSSAATGATGCSAAGRGCGTSRRSCASP